MLVYGQSLTGLKHGLHSCMVRSDLTHWWASLELPVLPVDWLSSFQKPRCRNIDPPLHRLTNSEPVRQADTVQVGRIWLVCLGFQWWLHAELACSAGLEFS
jgi:hypothetical protein